MRPAPLLHYDSRGRWAALLGLFLLPLLATSAAAAEAPGVNSGDVAWVLTASALVLFMTLPGLALFYGGLVRARNLLSVLMHCFAICCVVSILWALVGYVL
jgi:Amt family ammonium transporter